MLLALVLLQARNIILRDDYRGPVLFLLIGSGLLIGSQLTQRSWQLLLSWMSLAIAPIALFFAIQLSASGDWSVQSMFDLYYATIQRSLGSINRLATLTTLAAHSTTHRHRLVTQPGRCSHVNLWLWL